MPRRRRARSSSAARHAREPYATSHEALDRDEAVRDEARQVARAVTRVAREMRAGKIQALLRRPQPRPK